MKLDPHRTAVVAVHLQGDVVTRDGAFGGFFADMVERTGVLGRSAELIGAARDAGAKIAYTRVVFSEGHPELIVNNQLFQVIDQVRCCADGTPGAAIVPEVAPEEGDLVVGHHRVTGTHGSALVGELRGAGVDTVLVLGVATNLSVEGTARNLVEEGFDTFVVTDCCTAADQATHDASIASLGLLATGLTDAGEAIDALQSGVRA